MLYGKKCVYIFNEKVELCSANELLFDNAELLVAKLLKFTVYYIFIKIQLILSNVCIYIRLN
ncbi:hypothetical protein acsn021_01920 [Anaerocolumna cellulosilytica]|uniref:Uncharacterized protein n=1 Tax=Anaerocolumna cellulosilytica TaxID=433286 RepID=A0A6S6QMR1_9FIRM|nr:hypothetical protein acsn021_01920 [Anaerocolumna cellulosilytica]